MFNLTSTQLDRTIWASQFKDFKLGDKDTLEPNNLDRLRQFFSTHRHNVFSLDCHAAHYAFPTTQSAWNGRGYTRSQCVQEHNYLCHYYWTSGYDTDNTTGLINIFPNNCRPKTNALFWNFMFSETESPWRDILDKIWVIRSDADETKGFPMGILWTDTKETNALLLTHFLIASRLLTGWALDVVYEKLLKMGFSEHTAFLLMCLFEHNNQTVTGREHFGDHFEKNTLKTTLTATGPHANDQPFGRYDGNFHSWRELSPQMFISGEYKKKTPYLLSSKPNLKETNDLWFGDQVYIQGKLGMDEDEDDCSFDSDWCCEDCNGSREDWEKSQKAKGVTQAKDAWGFKGMVKGTKAVDPGLVKEWEDRMRTGKLLDFAKKD